MSSLFAELKRRNVFRVGAAYLALGWIVTQVTATVGPAMNLPTSLTPIVVWIGVIAFPFVLLFSWIYELTPEGLKREHEVERTESITNATAKKLDTIVIALLVLAIGLFVFDRFSPRAPPLGAGLPANPSAPEEFAAKAAPTGPATPAAQAAVAPTDNSIAVLPFVNMSSDKEQDYFSDGLSEELLNLLAQVEGLRVIARTSSFSFKGKDLDIATIAKQLNVANVLEGSVRRAGNTLRVTAQLVRASDSSHLWSKSFDREMADVFKVQDEIAGEVVGALKLKLLPGTESGARTSNPEAYNKYLLGHQYFLRQTPDAWKQGVNAYQEAIALDANYAGAWAGLAVVQMYAADYEPTLADINAAKQRAVAASERAIQLDPHLAEAHLARVSVQLAVQWDWSGAEAAMQRALELAPGDARVRNLYGYLLSVLGRFEESAVAVRQATELDPLSANAWNGLAGALWLVGDRAGAREAAKRSLAIAPESDFSLNALGYLDLFDGKPEAALESFRKASHLWVLVGSAMAEHSLGHAEASQRALDEMESRYADMSAYQIAEIHAWRGDKDRAFAWLERAFVQRDGGLPNIKNDPIMDSLRDDPRYGAILKKLGLPP